MEWVLGRRNEKEKKKKKELMGTDRRGQLFQGPAVLLAGTGVPGNCKEGRVVTSGL